MYGLLEDLACIGLIGLISAALFALAASRSKRESKRWQLCVRKT